MNITFPDSLGEFINTRILDNSDYESVDEYIIDLVQRDYEAQKKNLHLADRLRPGMLAEKDEFKPFSAYNIISEAKARHKNT